MTTTTTTTTTLLLQQILLLLLLLLLLQLYSPWAVGTNGQRSQIKWTKLRFDEFEYHIIVTGVSGKIEPMPRTQNTPATPQRLHTISMQYNSLYKLEGQTESGSLCQCYVIFPPCGPRLTFPENFSQICL